MHIDITLKNYRCFPDSSPARFSIRKGLTSFVGVNNSGKSSLLKFFYEFRGLFEHLTSPTGNLINSLKGNREGFQLRGVLDIEEVFSNTTERDIEMEFNFIEADYVSPAAAPVPRQLRVIVPRASNTYRTELYVEGGHQFALDEKPVTFEGPRLRIQGTATTIDLGGMFKAFERLSKFLYIPSFRNAINVGTNADYYDIHVGQAFMERWRDYKTGNVKRHNEAIYRLTSDIRQLFAFNELEVDPTPEGTTLQVFINGRSYKLPELGSGLAQFIIVLANAAIKPSPYILIDEPELNLHPSLQLDFLTTLASYAGEGVLFGTHSVGLAQASAERIYSVRKLAESKSEVTDFEATPRLAELLGELSFSGYRELGFDKVLLVEGVTDVKTFQQLLRLYGKAHEVVLLPLGGAQFIRETVDVELEELKRISPHVYAVIDSERSGAGAPLGERREAFRRLCAAAGIECHVLERRAIENYLSDSAIKRIKGEKYRARESYESLNAPDTPAWGKEENWRIAREMRAQDLEGTDLGHFLQDF